MRGRLVRPRRFPTMLKIRPAALLLPVIWTMASCGTPHVEKTDANSEPQRIVTLNGTLTEIVAALGRADRIVGVDVTSTWPEKIAGVPRVGHDRTVRAEGVIALEPDLVLAAPGQLNTTVRGQLQQAGQRVVELPQDHSVEGTRTLIRQVAELLHDPAEGERLIAAMDLDLARVKPIAEPPKVLFIYARGAGSLMVSGEGTPMHHIIELAGGRNAVAGFKEYKPLTPEALIAADPDAILLFSSGMDALQGVEGLMQVPGMAATRAGRNKAFIAMDGGLISNFGPRLGQAVIQLNTAFHEVAIGG